MTTQPRTGFARPAGHVDVEDALGAAIRRWPALVPVAATRGTTASARPFKPRPRTEWHTWRRLILRMLGISYPLQNAILDPRRWTVTVTSHAVQQAGLRFRDGNPAVIAADVAAAIAEGRIGKRAPRRSVAAYGSAVHAWTEDESKTYVIRRSHRSWIVITALPAEAAA